MSASAPSGRDAPEDAAAGYVLSLDEVGLDDVAAVGGKTASLGELRRLLRGGAVTTPDGFAVTAVAYRDVLTAAGAWPKLASILEGLDINDVGQVAARGAEARAIIYQATDNARLKAAIVAAWREMGSQDPTLRVAVRSSATAEDLPEASFAGQHDSFLHVTGEAGVVEACRRCFASLFTDRAIVYRAQNGFDHLKVALSVAVMRMVNADDGASGVAFTIDTETAFPEVVFITGAWGLGEGIVQGRVAPDEFYVHKPTYRAGYRAVLRRTLGAKETRLVRPRRGAGSGVLRERAVPRRDRERFCITDEDVLELAGAAIAVEDHYSAQAGRRMPMDLEWARDGADGRLYILQARPETAASRRPEGVYEVRRLDPGKAPILASGKAVGQGVASGTVRVIATQADLEAFVPGEVLVAETTSPDWLPAMRNAAAIVTDKGGRTCHAAIVARELGIPAVVGTGDATRRLGAGQAITVSCARGEEGAVYAGQLPFSVERLRTADLPPTRTAIMLNLAQPDAAFQAAGLPAAGVGLARIEFIISQLIGIHPMAAAHPDRVASARARRAIEAWARADDSPRACFVRQLAEGVGAIAAAFYPRPVIVRLSDFKTNEYASLTGGRGFEPVEENPMLGFRGAARYAHPLYADGFALECEALARVRDVMGLTNVRLMVPFCRRVEEGQQVLEALAAHGLRQGPGGVEVYVMCEIPNNVIQIDAFARLFDGFSIGSNDLTQLILGVDRDSTEVAFDFDERDPGVLEMLRQAVAGAKRNGRPIGICGEAPASWPEVAALLARAGIDSISVNPASFPQTVVAVARAEAEAAMTAA
ncbi:phosphoenolpyruvate synthase [Brevundimonas denitrificans]|uniref:Phosphoenolpyruvate synthase n=1 Tax=Brevundimonas denitrificans TaxID=1443434 RepID=A0ABQ6BGE1_9CAUL|nr:phosphoenolpyruvate synthase [Brevundimonas denitrificans]GLS01110.1 phosphoenolpyruvate synthase [Brevundimonas denitrificans]